MKFKSLYCVESKKYIYIRNKKIYFSDVPVLVAPEKYDSKVTSLSFNDKLFLQEKCEIHHITCLVRFRSKIKAIKNVDLITKSPYKYTMGDVALIKENINKPFPYVYEFFKDKVSQSALRAFIYRIKNKNIE